MLLVAKGQEYNIGEKPTVILYTYINQHHAGTQKHRQETPEPGLDYSM